MLPPSVAAAVSMLAVIICLLERASAFTNPKIFNNQCVKPSEASRTADFRGRRHRTITRSSFAETEELAGMPFSIVEKIFPGAIPYSEMLDYLITNLAERDYHISDTLCATSLCGDELNRPLEEALNNIFSESYRLGGMAGFPFGGLTAFQKMKMHIPDGGNCVIVHASHVGVDSQGKVGTVERPKCENGDMCCRSAMLAADYVMGVLDGKPETPPPTDMLDASQYYVGTMLMPHAERLKNSDDPMVELPFAVYEEQTKLMKRIVQEGSQYGGFPGNVAVLGGIQVNTPPGMVDYFVPLNFSFYNGDGKFQENLLQDSDPWAWS